MIYVLGVRFAGQSDVQVKEARHESLSAGLSVPLSNESGERAPDEHSHEKRVHLGQKLTGGTYQLLQIGNRRHKRLPRKTFQTLMNYLDKVV